MINFIKNYWQLTIISIIFWCILNESFTLQTIGLGLIVGVVTSVAVHALFTDKQSFSDAYRVPIISMIRFLIVLIINIYHSAFRVVGEIFFVQSDPVIVIIKTRAQGDWERSLIANAITLTPGTVTIDKKDNMLTVLWLKPKHARLEDAKEIIQGDFERVFIKGGL